MIHHPNYSFDSTLIQVTSDGQVKAYRSTSKEFLPLTFPLDLYVLEEAKFFPDYEPLGFLKSFKSPLFLVMMITLIMIMYMPKLLKSLDPEIMKELQNRHQISTSSTSSRIQISNEMSSSSSSPSVSKPSSSPHPSHSSS
jgi:ER membrane protein complex subunit 7